MSNPFIRFYIFILLIFLLFLLKPAVSKNSYSLQRQKETDANTLHGRNLLAWIYIFLFIPPLFLTLRELYLDPTTPVLISILWRRLKELVSYAPAAESEAEGDAFVQRLISESKLRRRKVLEKEEEAAIAKAEEGADGEKEDRRMEGTPQKQASVSNPSATSSLRENYFSRNGLLELLRQRSKATTADAENVANDARLASETRSMRNVTLPK